MFHFCFFGMSSATLEGMGHLLGYARVSTTDQDAALQVDALNAAGCYRVFVDTISGSLDQRPELTKLLDQLRPGDTLVVWRLDRLGRSIRHLIDQLTALQDKGIGFKSLQETIDTTSPGGRLVFHVFAALAEFERDLIKERTNAGLAAARARGRTGGPRLSPHQVTTARRMYEQQDMTVEQIGQVLGVSRTTIYRTLKRDQVTPTKGRKPRSNPPAGSVAAVEAIESGLTSKGPQ
jgi:DNA invertase Pin-like site-specific DNA recombinase